LRKIIEGVVFFLNDSMITVTVHLSC